MILPEAEISVSCTFTTPSSIVLREQLPASIPSDLERETDLISSDFRQLFWRIDRPCFRGISPRGPYWCATSSVHQVRDRIR